MLDMGATRVHMISQNRVQIAAASKRNSFTSSLVDFHGQNCQPFRDVSTMTGDTISGQHERTISGLEQKRKRDIKSCFNGNVLLMMKE